MPQVDEAISSGERSLHHSAAHSPMAMSRAASFTAAAARHAPPALNIENQGHSAPMSRTASFNAADRSAGGRGGGKRVSFESSWQAVKDATSGRTYYWSPTLNKTVWKKPPELEPHLEDPKPRPALLLTSVPSQRLVPHATRATSTNPNPNPVCATSTRALRA